MLTSSLCEIREIPNAGRGVIATQSIAADTLLHASGPPAVHVIFKNYSKETCAYCFAWDRGRTLPVREHELGKGFCSKGCSTAWVQETAEVGVEAWRILTAFVKAKNSSKRPSEDEVMADGPPPLREEIGESWRAAAKKGDILRNSRVAAPASKKERKFLQTVMQRTTQCEDPDMLGYFLSGVLFEHQQPLKTRQEILELAMDDKPYKTKQDLDNSCNAFLQLTSILPEALLPSLTPELCLNLVRADNHNAFGIRGGGEDSEEYMGYGVYPSASYFNHSCAPNLAKRRIGRSWEFRAARDVAPGEECCITYLGGDEKDLDLGQRRARLGETWGFECACARCTREFRSTLNGKVVPDRAYGEAPVGILIYTASGYMSATITATEPNLRPSNLTFPYNESDPDSEWALVGKHSLGYAGPYRVSDAIPADTRHGQLLHGPLVVANVPRWVGSELRRNYTVVEQDDGCVLLYIHSKRDGGNEGHLWWKKLD